MTGNEIRGLIVDETDTTLVRRITSPSLGKVSMGYDQTYQFAFPKKFETALRKHADAGSLEATATLLDPSIVFVDSVPVSATPYRPSRANRFDWSKFDVVPPREFHGRLFFDLPTERAVPYSRRSLARMAEASYFQISYLIGEVWAEQLAIAMENLSTRGRASFPDLMREAAAHVLQVAR